MVYILGDLTIVDGGLWKQTCTVAEFFQNLSQWGPNGRCLDGIMTGIDWYPLIICYIAMERSTIFNGKTHYKWPFSIAILT